LIERRTNPGKSLPAGSSLLAALAAFEQYSQNSKYKQGEESSALGVSSTLLSLLSQ